MAQSVRYSNHILQRTIVLLSPNPLFKSHLENGYKLRAKCTQGPRRSQIDRSTETATNAHGQH